MRRMKHAQDLRPQAPASLGAARCAWAKYFSQPLSAGESRDVYPKT
ncbi:protein of unknown function [Pararobbsia alpina]